MASPQPFAFLVYALVSLAAGLLLAWPAWAAGQRGIRPDGPALRAVQAAQGISVLLLLAGAAFLSAALVLRLGMQNYWFFW